MIKKCLLILLTFSGCYMQAQELFFTTGKNFTTYNYKNALGMSNPNLRSGEGSFYQIGMDFKLNKSAVSRGWLAQWKTICFLINFVFSSEGSKHAVNQKLFQGR